MYALASSFVSRGVDSRRVQRLSYEWECCCAFLILKYRHAWVRPQLTELACSECPGRTGVGVLSCCESMLAFSLPPAVEVRALAVRCLLFLRGATRE